MNGVWKENGEYTMEFAGVTVYAVSASFDAAAALYSRMERGGASALHVHDIVDDWLGIW